VGNVLGLPKLRLRKPAGREPSEQGDIHGVPLDELALPPPEEGELPDGGHVADSEKSGRALPKPGLIERLVHSTRDLRSQLQWNRRLHDERARLLEESRMSALALRGEMRFAEDLEVSCRRLQVDSIRANREAAYARRDLERLQRATAALYEVSTFDQVIRVLQVDVVQVVEARAAVLALGNSGEPLRFVGDVEEPRFETIVLPEVVEEQIRGNHAIWRSSSREIAVLPIKTSGTDRGAVIFRFSPGCQLLPSNRRMVQEVARLVGMAVDRAVLLQKANAALARAEEANRSKDEFLAVLGHELRNPLSPMVAALHLLRMRQSQGGVEPTKEQEVLERQVRHMMRLVDDLLDLSRVARGTLALSRTPVEIETVIHQAVEMTEPLFAERRHRLDVHVPCSGLVVSADANRLTQALSNLLTNAAKYTSNGGHIEIHSRAVEGHVCVDVVDNGDGIAPSLLPRMFEAFVQGGDKGLDRAGGGLGLGLAIVRRIVELHGGTVNAWSAGVGRGSTFSIDLPLLDPERPSPSRTAATPATTARPAIPVEPSRRVLVVDDNEDAAQMIREELMLSGHTVCVAHNAMDALQTAAAFRPDVALLDIGLPVMDGYDLCRELRRTEKGRPRLLIIAITGYGGTTAESRSAEAGFDAFLVKPVDFDRVEQVMRESRPLS
jgi:signal transduction histidine kinase/ActR/RegA family two-component response regulator